MPTILNSGGQTRLKNSYASAPSLDLTLICNGEDQTSLFDSFGNILIAGIEAPTSSPSVIDGGSGGSLTAGYVCYRYVYAATRRYPFVENVTAAGGSVAPRSNPSPSSSPFLSTVSHKNTITVQKTTRSDISKIWIYRTAVFSTALLASEASEAGELFYLGQVSNDGSTGTTTYTDNTAVVAGEQLEFDNFVAPTAAFCVYYDPYFYLFGNLPLTVQVTVSYNTVGPVTTITLDDENVLKWFKGRDGQFIKFEGITSGGYDGFGTYYFRWLTTTTAQLVTDTTLNTNGYIGQLGTTTATIYGYANTLYRSKANNPFGWGKTVTLGTLAIPELWTLLVGGGVGTGIAVLPSNAILKLDTENPAKSYSLNLRLQDSDDFEATLRILSENYSTSLNSTQFSTLNSGKQSVLWSLDTKTYSIIESDGSGQMPISDKVINFLRNIDSSEDAQRNYHGIFDPFTECNFLWVREQNANPVITHCVYQHVPTGQWGLSLDFDITASALLQDPTTNTSIILGGTDTGIFGQILKPFKYVNWLDDPTTNIPNAYLITALGKNPNLVSIVRTAALEQAEHLTYFTFSQFNSSLVEKTFFVFLDVDSTGDPAPAASAGFDYVIRVSEALGATALTLLANIRVTVVGAAPGIFSYFSIPSSSNNSTNLGGTYNAGVALTAASEGTTYNFDSITSYPNGYRLQLLAYSGQSYPLLTAVIGRWILVETSADNLNKIWIRVVSSDGARFIYDTFYGDESLLSSASASVLTSHLTAYFGLIECKLQKAFDLNSPTKRKTLKEYWVHSNGNFTQLVSGNNHYYTDKLLLGYTPQTDEEPSSLTIPNQDTDKSGSARDTFWINAKNVPSNPFKTFGVMLVDRGYGESKISNITLKMTT